MMRRRLMLTGSLAAMTGLAACGTKKQAIPGVQIPVLPQANVLAVSDNAPAVTVPAAVPVGDWPQMLASPTHAPGNIAGPTGMKQAWRASIGAPGGPRQPLSASPIAAAGLVFTMDSNNAVTAFSATDGTQKWRLVTRPKHLTVQSLGGGIAYDAGTGNGIIYASTGYAELLAIDAAAGSVIWRQPLDFPARSAPTVAGGVVAVLIQNDLLLTFDPASGTPGWRYLGRINTTPISVAVSGAPAFSAGIMVAGFSSGTLAALDVNSGTPIWQQSMASSYGVASPLAFSDIVAPPVIADGVAYAIGLGDTALAIDLHSGAKVWERDTTGTQAIYLAGGFAYLLDIEQQLAAIHADDGLVSWIIQMPNFRNMKKKKGDAQTWNGPIMLNGQLVFTSNLGNLITVDPTTGALGPMVKLKGPADLPPIIAGGAALVLTRDATLTAYS